MSFNLPSMETACVGVPRCCGPRVLSTCDGGCERKRQGTEEQRAGSPRTYPGHRNLQEISQSFPTGHLGLAAFGIDARAFRRWAGGLPRELTKSPVPSAFMRNTCACLAGSSTAPARPCPGLQGLPKRQRPLSFASSFCPGGRRDTPISPFVVHSIALAWSSLPNSAMPRRSGKSRVTALFPSCDSRHLSRRRFRPDRVMKNAGAAGNEVDYAVDITLSSSRQVGLRHAWPGRDHGSPRGVERGE